MGSYWAKLKKFIAISLAISGTIVLNLLFVQCSPLKISPSSLAQQSLTSTTATGVVTTTIGGSTTTTTMGSGTTTTLITSPAGAYFPSGNIWTSDISNATAHPKDSDSDAVIANLKARGGWGTGKIRMDMSIKVLSANTSTPKIPFSLTVDTPDTDHSATVPVPTGGSLEGNPGLQCLDGGDCHLVVWDQSAKLLYESWSTNFDGTKLTSPILVIWDLTKNYPVGRGDGCTSADAAGFPIAPLLFSADEVAAGHIDHAIRLILPNDRWRNSSFVHPATHSGGGTNGNTGGVLYGSRFRLKASVDVSTLSAPAKVVAAAMKKYGMFAADGGQIALTAMSDMYTTHKWSEFPQPADPRFAPIDLSVLNVDDFEIVNDGRGTGSGYDCVRVFP